jgi:hypothetical protein
MARKRKKPTAKTQAAAQPAKTQAAAQETHRSRFWWFFTGWRLGLELITFVGLPIALYALRPILSVASLEPSDLHGNNGSKASITVSGTKIKEVKVQCVTNKVIFDDTYTLAFNRFVLVDEYAVSDVAAGESFPADCNFAWALWRKQNIGFFLMGTGTPGKPQLAIPLTFSEDGMPSIMPNAPLSSTVIPDFAGYTRAQVTAIDGQYVVLYKWSLFPILQRRVIHMIGRRHDNSLKWHVTPNSEAIIPDAEGGWVVTLNGPPDKWGVTLRRASPQ